MPPSCSVILAKTMNLNFQQMLPLIYTHIDICTNPYY